MKPDDVKQLLGGYATGTLSAEEQKALFDAALQDQELFDALTREQALKDVLDDDGLRRELIAGLQPAPSWRDRLALWVRPAYSVTAAVALAAATFAVVYVVRETGPAGGGETQVAEVRRPAETPAVVLPAAPIETPKVRSVQGAAPAVKTKNEVVGPLLPVQRQPVPEPMALADAPAATAVKEEPRAVEQRSFRASMRAPAAESQPAVREARDLFYAAPLPPGAPVGGVIGGVPGGSGGIESRAKVAVYAPSAATTALGVRYSVARKGAEFEVVLESNTDAVAYLFRRTAVGEWIPVMPGGMSLKAHAPATAPAFAPDAVAAQPRTILVLSRRTLPELAQSGPALTTAIDALRAQADSSRLMRQTTDTSNFAVAPPPRPSETIVVPVSLP